MSTKPQLQPDLPPDPSEDTYCPRTPYWTAFPPSHPKPSAERAAECTQDRSKASRALLGWGLPMLSLNSPVMQYFSKVRQAKYKYNLCFPLTLSTCFCPFLPAETKHNFFFFPRNSGPKFLCDSEHQTTFWFPNQKWVKPKFLRDLVQASLCKSLPKLLWFAKQARNLLLNPFFCLEIPCAASLSPQMDICASLAVICIAGTSRKLKQDQSSLVLGVVKTKTVQKEKTKRREGELGISPMSPGS